jgi:DNA-binding NarL/FixJ family response regulator
MTETDSPPPPQRVLLVEDNTDFEQSLLHALAQACPAHATTVCNTGASALAHLNAAGGHYDLVLVDIGLPDLSGLEVVALAHRRWSDTPIMVISVISNESSVLAAIRAGARGYIHKGDSAVAITAAIADVLAGNCPISPSLARILFRMAGGPGAAQPPGAASTLSLREAETLRHIAQGHTYLETADLMGIKLATVQTNIRKIFHKLDATNQMVAVSRARASGWI